MSTLWDKLFETQSESKSGTAWITLFEDGVAYKTNMRYFDKEEIRNALRNVKAGLEPITVWVGHRWEKFGRVDDFSIVFEED